MRRQLSLFFVLILLFSCLCGCNSSGKFQKRDSVLAELDLHMYSVFLSADQTDMGKVCFRLTGKLPSEAEPEGLFDGQIVMEDEEGNLHIYENMKYRWNDSTLVLRTEDEQLSCLYDPKNPNHTLLIDRQWETEVSAKEIVAYLDDSLTLPEAQSISDSFQAVEGICSTVFITREEALEEFKRKHENEEAFSSVDASYLRHRYAITLEATADVATVVAQVEALKGVEEVYAPNYELFNIRYFSTAETAEDMVGQIIDAETIFNAE